MNLELKKTLILMVQQGIFILKTRQKVISSELITGFSTIVFAINNQTEVLDGSSFNMGYIDPVTGAPATGTPVAKQSCGRERKLIW